MQPCQLPVFRFVGGDGGFLFVADRAYHFAGDAHDQASRRDLCPFRNQCPGSNQTSRADHSTVEHCGVHADHAAVTDHAAVQYGAVPYRNSASQHNVQMGAGVQHHIVLHIAAGPYHNAAGICPQHGAIPYAGAFCQLHVACQGGVFCHKSGVVRVGSFPAYCIQCHRFHLFVSLSYISGAKIAKAVLNMLQYTRIQTDFTDSTNGGFACPSR